MKRNFLGLQMIEVLAPDSGLAGVYFAAIGGRENRKEAVRPPFARRMGSPPSDIIWTAFSGCGDRAAMGYLLRFGVFELNLVTEELRKFGTPIKLPPQPFKVLALLASQAGQVVTREQIQLQVWGEETYVDFEQGMNQCIKQIRNVLSDSADTPRYIETLPRRGYRFIAPVEAQVLPSEQQQLNIKLVETTRPAPNGAALESRGAAVSGHDAGRATASEILPIAQPPATANAIPEHTAATTQAGRKLAPQASSGKRQDRRKILVVAAVLLFGAGVGFLTQRLLRQNVGIHRETLLVLPFEAAEQDSASNALARGLSESITGKLVQAHNQR